MPKYHRRAVLALATGSLAMAAVTSAAANPLMEPLPSGPAPSGAKPVTAIIHLVAGDPVDFEGYLTGILPATRLAAGCRYAHLYRDATRPQHFTLIEGWNSAEQQQAYLSWRQRRGDVSAMLSRLAEAPVFESLSLLDA
jgi:quinol monooxygenase YgiN